MRTFPNFSSRAAIAFSPPCFFISRFTSANVALNSASAARALTTVALAAAYHFWGARLLPLMPHGQDYAAYARHMPWLVAIAAMTSCQVFQTNSEVSAGRFGFLAWLVPLHIVYPAVLYLVAECGYVNSLDRALVFFGAASCMRFAFAAWPHLRA